MNEDILIVDDQPEVITLLTFPLIHEGFSVRSATTPAEALEKIFEKTPNLLILDILMPQMDGLTFCRKLRDEYKYNNLPILFLSALGKTDHVVNGLNAGGDDYISKPFEVRELIARVKAQLRRVISPTGGGNAILKVGDLVLDGKSYEVRTPKLSAHLTATEYKLVRYMAERAEKVISYGELLQAIWSYPPDSGDPDLVRTHMRNIRAKLERDPDVKDYFHTVHGTGYMFRVSKKEKARPKSSF
jgi:DNA-binding response OmpR family regulator